MWEAFLSHTVYLKDEKNWENKLKYFFCVIYFFFLLFSVMNLLIFFSFYKIPVKMIAKCKKKWINRTFIREETPEGTTYEKSFFNVWNQFTLSLSLSLCLSARFFCLRINFTFFKFSPNHNCSLWCSLFTIKKNGLVCWVLWHINFYRLFIPKSIFM